jgi:acyl-coenzyme A thioesterase PaaI-like protein
MSQENRLSRIVKHLGLVPGPLRAVALTAVVRRTVPFTATAGLRVEELAGERVAVRLTNRRPVRNHIGTLHAAAMALAAETCSGFVVAMNVPDSRTLVIKSLKVEFKKRCTGALRAVATLTPEQIASCRTTEKGEVSVAVTATDDAGVEPIRCEMIWAWVPRKR